MRQKKLPLRPEQKFYYFNHCVQLNTHLLTIFSPLEYACCMAIFDEYWKNNCILLKKLSTFVPLFQTFLKINKHCKLNNYRADLDPARTKVKYILSTIVDNSDGVIGFSTDKKYLKIPHLDKQFENLEKLERQLIYQPTNQPTRGSKR